MLAFLDSILSSEKRKNWLRYLTLTFGEIVLIIIGILIALKFEGNQKDAEDSIRLNNRIETLKLELKEDIGRLKSQDSTYTVLEQNAELVIKAFFSAQKVDDLKLIDSLQYFYWDDLFISTSIYNELVNTGLIYKIENAELKKSIFEYYEEVASTRKFMWLVNESQLAIQAKKEMYPYLFLFSMLHSNGLSQVDTSWIGNPKHPTFLTVAYHLNTNQIASNKERRRFFQTLIQKAEKIISYIDEEGKR